MEQSVFIRLEDISKTFPGVRALDHINLTVRHGEVHALVGENGAGKSTLIKILAGNYKPDAGGKITIEDETFSTLTPKLSLDKGIVVIYQDFSLFPNLTVAENISITEQMERKGKCVSWKQMQRSAREALDKLGVEIDVNLQLGTLSTAKQQLVAIARALACDAKLNIMDEPTSTLSGSEVQLLFKIIRDLKAQGISILFVSHKLDEVFEISERFSIMRSGQMVATGNTADLDDKKFSYYMTGREFESEPFKPSYQSKENVLEVKNLTLDGSFEDISFNLRRGEILGITGLLDSGRTELALSLFGLRKATGGQIVKDGKPVKIANPRDAIAAGIGFVPEDRLSEGLFLTQSIADNIIISEIDHLSNGVGVLNRKQCKDEVDKWVKELAIKTPDPQNACTTLSGGNQQRIVLAKWLACKPDVLILNGPTVGVDIGSKHDIHAILQRLADQGMAVIIISDDLPEVLGNCSKMLVMKKGRIVAQLEPAATDETTVLSHMM